MKNRLFDIVTDSTCDMPSEYYAEHSVECVPLGFMMDGANYQGEDGEAISEKEFYAKLRAGSMPTTYQVTAESAKPHIEKSLQEGRDVLVLAFSSGLSGTAASFAMAAKELSEIYPERKIRVVDSLAASMGEGLLLDYVIQKADSGATLDEVADYAEDLKGKICHLFTVDNLFHLKRGGRCSSATAIIGSILKIKPVLHVDDAGKLVVIGKAMGRKKALATLVDKMVATHDMCENDRIFISHGDCAEDVDYVVSLLKTRFPKAEIFVHYIGAVIGAHAGAGTIALFYKGKKR